uniref:Uncharacterized protein n=1 Tax=Nothoprocta perdicaria TaxID=30464 RepID=A0A8C6YPD6_NOTPE
MSIKEFLRRQKCGPSEGGENSARDNWSDPEKVLQRMEECHAKFKDGKGKGVICAILGGCLIQAQKDYKVSEKLKLDYQSKKLEIQHLQYELEKEKRRTQLLEQRIETMLMQAPRPPNMQQIRKLITNTEPEDWDGDIWGDPDKEIEEESSHLVAVRPLIKTETSEGPQGRNPRTTVWTTPFSGSELGKLQTKFSRKPGETKTEYLWRVSLSGGFWGPGVFLEEGFPDDNRSITAQVAYWAGGIDPRERGEPLVIKFRGLSGLSEAMQKAVCIQAMYDRGHSDVPLMAPVNPVHLRPLIKGLPDTAKIYMQNLKERVIRAQEHNDHNIHTPPIHVPTWADLLHDMVSYGREMAWSHFETQSEQLGRGRKVFHTSKLEGQSYPKHEPGPFQGLPTPVNQMNSPLRNDLWRQALALGVPCAMLQGQSPSCIRKLVEILERKKPDGKWRMTIDYQKLNHNTGCIQKGR